MSSTRNYTSSGEPSIAIITISAPPGSTYFTDARAAKPGCFIYHTTCCRSPPPPLPFPHTYRSDPRRPANDGWFSREKERERRGRCACDKGLGAWGLVAGAPAWGSRRSSSPSAAAAAATRRPGRPSAPRRTPVVTNRRRLPGGARGTRDGGTSAHGEARPTNEPGTRPRDGAHKAAPLPLSPATRGPRSGARVRSAASAAAA